MSAPARLVRTRGIEAPYNKDQVAAFVLHPIISVAFVILSAITLSGRELGAVLAPFIILSVMVVAFWWCVSWADPAEDGGCTLRKKGANTPHYCSFCRKTVKGFDHHCSWLNTCISARNYLHFYFLGVTGSLLYGYMLTVGILVQFLVPKEDLIDVFGTESGARVPWGVFAAVSAWVALSFVILAAFHTYLLCIGLGTFDWVVLQGQRRQEQLARRRNGEQQPRRPFQCCDWRGGEERWGSDSLDANVQDVSTSASSSGRRTSGGTREAAASGGWGGSRGMGAGVTPTEPSWARPSSDSRLRGEQASGVSTIRSVNGDPGNAPSETRLPVP